MINDCCFLQVLRVKTQDGIPTHEIYDVFSDDGSSINLITGATKINNQMFASSLYDKLVMCDLLSTGL